MKKRLLMLFAVFMAVTSVEWVQAQSASVSTADELKAAVTEGKNPINLSADTFKLSEQLVINKSLTTQEKIGTAIMAVGDNWPENKENGSNLKLTNEFYQQFPNKASGWNNGYTFVYANGNPVTIESSADGKVKISVDDTDEYIEILESKNPVIFGGSKNKVVASSQITVKSGKLNMLFGGGYGETNGSKSVATAEPAGVAGSTTITMTGGTVTGNLLGGGLYYNHSKDVVINLSGETTIGQDLSWLICGGFESGQTYGTFYDEFAKSNNTVETAHLNIDGGTYFYIGIGGTDGNRGYVKQSTATVKNATINGGVFGNGSNGRSDKVTGTFENCEFVKNTKYPIEIAGVNRGKVKDITFTFKNCTFPENGETYNVYAYLGGTYQWSTNYSGSEIGIPEQVSFTFEGGTNVPNVGISGGLEAASVTLTGTKGYIASFEVSDKIRLQKFAVPASKTWTFNNGLSLASDITFENNGTLNVVASTAQELTDAISAGANNLTLKAGTYELESHLSIAKPVLIEGTIADKDSTIIKPASNWSGSDNGYKNLVRIDAPNTSLKNLLVEGSTTGSGIHVFKATGVTLDNVISRNNASTGLIIDGSTVSATNFRTFGNKEYGVNVDKGEGVDGTPVFTIGSGCSFAEAVAIKSNEADAPANYVVGDGWFKTKQDGASIWINGATSGLNFAITSVPASVIYGQSTLPLLTNVDSTYYKAGKVKISVDNEAVAKIEKDSLQILKPGKVNLTLAVGDTAVTRSLDVLKKTLTIMSITAKTRPYNGSKDVELVTTAMKVNGLVGEHTSDGVIIIPTKGEALSADAGIQPVKVTATLKSEGFDYNDYYELADITGVMDTIKKVKLTYKTATPEAIDFGKVSTKTFTAALADGTNFVNNEDTNVLGGTLQFDCPATDASLAGKYPVMPYGYTSNN